ncbi:dihydroxyacetone kinase subunit L [Enterococcus ureilyticus]|uniref:phosphoenolpyruvate--glycerone phosphotransferase n=1 Tax=Enterococcus ureilyticus TaxID=1131292 RepID=A0A1E5HFF6_9ENTE|nr:dihydroxyacetone kinase subunit DhaL [Enterococcus ureilyticus]MBM7689259.1 dihydroxyacetone kinase-like protein [Enterococcus ureilyticus]MBO0446388.1 dihydroxyacetone kinase subunit L [Enterococcus ureilyticus]OEG23535.1 dihydroxyacetone kinase subunit L [Enterococcus ureilyticus]
MTTEVIANKTFFKNSLIKMAELSEEQRDYWTSLDSNIGDGDHGINLSIGFRGISKEIEELDQTTEDIHSLLKKSGMILLSKVGGASGPLYGSFFIKMGKEVEGKTEVTFPEFVEMLQSGIDAIQARGKAELQDKTMLDALLPGIEYLQAHKNEEDYLTVMEKAIQMMQEGAESTIPLIAKKGRAMRLGERAIGHKDPGAESSWMLLNVFYEEMKKNN